MLDDLLHTGRPPSRAADAALLAALERASGAIARLDQALDDHPLLPAFLYRARLEAVRRQASVDGHGIDPWHLAATLEGLRLRVPDYPGIRIIDRCQVFEAARTALGLHQWIVEPDFDQEGEVQAAERHLAPTAGGLVDTGEAVWDWLAQGGRRAPIRGALVRNWKTRRLLQSPVPLTGSRALAADAPQNRSDWVVAFIDAVAVEAWSFLELLRQLQHGWLDARRRAQGRRTTSRAALAVDVLAAAPLLSATTLAGAIGMSIKCAGELLDRFAKEGIAVEVTHRSARRLFGLAGMAPVRDASTAPRRPEPGRGRGRPRLEPDPEPAELPPVISASFQASRAAWPAIDYGALEAAMAFADETIRRTRRSLDALLAAPAADRIEADAVRPSNPDQPPASDDV